MALFKKKLNQSFKMLAVQLACEHFATTQDDVVEFDQLTRHDVRVKVIDTASIIPFFKVVDMVFAYLQNKPVTEISASDAEIYANALRYEVIEFPYYKVGNN